MLNPTLTALAAARPMLWLNQEQGGALPRQAPAFEMVTNAEARLARNAPLLALLFPELAARGGIVSSPLEDANALRNAAMPPCHAAGHWFVKRDDLLPVAGSIKARGGFHEVLAIAEDIALRAGVLDEPSPRTLLAESHCRELFARHTIAVGSTGNLGLSIGMIGAALGFQTVVHMSLEAKAWKKDRLRQRQVRVVEHDGDYASAVAAGRADAASTARMHFVDDESSELLFLGYAAAAKELAAQLVTAGRRIDRDHPLFVYIPCGVGGAPGGITVGLKAIFGDAVHCFFAEPCASPCMLLRLAGSRDVDLSVYDIGLDNRTAADGLAVGRASPFVAPIMRTQLAGIFTVDDERLFINVGSAKRLLGIDIEPSAAAALDGPSLLLQTKAGIHYLDQRRIDTSAATHVVWTTGGSLVPPEEHARFQQLAESAGRSALAQGSSADYLEFA